MTFIPLEEKHITQHLEKKFFSIPFKLHLLHSIDSTNCYLKNLAASSVLDICCAEMQTQGRGRFGRHWYSPLGENIYCSMRFDCHSELGKLAGLSLVCSLAVLATIHSVDTSPEIKIKWPNDILWNNKKLCGTLIELMNTPQVIIGIGLNVNSDPMNTQTEIGQAWTSLYELSQKQYDRNTIVANLIVHVTDYISRFMAHNLNCFMAEWKQYDYLAGKYITLNQAMKSISGIAQGINTQGQLILKDDEGVEHYCSSGET